MDTNLKNRFKDICKKIATVMPGSSRWEPDDRFNTVVAVLEKNDAGAVLSALQTSFDQEWSKKNIRKSPAGVKSIADSVSGINKGQILFATDDTIGPALFAAWWPWGDGTNISLRIGISDPSLNKEAILKQMAEWLG